MKRLISTSQTFLVRTVQMSSAVWGNIVVLLGAPHHKIAFLKTVRHDIGKSRIHKRKYSTTVQEWWMMHTEGKGEGSARKRNMSGREKGVLA
jgi:hypothetical protein